MLNELYSLKKSLVQSGLQLTGHPDINDFSQRDGITVIVGEDGSLEIKSIGTTQNKWRYNPDNQLSFPASKIFGPLIQPESLPQSFIKKYKDFKKSKERNKEELQKLENAAFEEFISIINDDNFSYEVTDNPQIWKKFEKSWTSAAQSVSEIFGDRLEKVKPVYRLVEALKKSATDKEQTIREKVRSFIDAIVEAVRKGRIEAGLAIELFLGKYNQKDDSWDNGEEVWIYFNVEGDGIESSRGAFSELLEQVESEPTGKDVENQSVCALTGEPQPPVKGTFPQVKVPVFQQKTALLAMNKDVFCHDRYGKIAADICKVGQKTANQLALALGFITSESMEGKTWKRIISDKEKKSDLLIVYCEPKPVNDAELAGYFDDYEDVEFDDDIDDEKEFTEKTKAVIDLLKLQIRDVDTSSITCLILRELDPGRRQLLYSDSFTVGDLKEDAELWQEGSRNVPERHFWIFKNAKSEKREKVGLTPISFKNAQELFQIKWIRGGAESCRTPGVSRGDIFALFLQRNYATCQANDLLRRLLENCYNLFVFVGAKIHLNKYNDISNEQRKRTLHCLEMIGVLLKILDYNMEVYMNQTAYNLGRLLALADQLHIFYCQDLRSGDIPMSLIGNALLPVAKTNPSQALSRLYDRLQIYMGWAKKYSNSKTPEEKLKAANKPAPGLVAWVMREITNVSNAIKDAMKESGKQLTDKLSDVEAAQLLLGYLAPNKGKNSPDSDDEQDETEESEK